MTASHALSQLSYTPIFWKSLDFTGLFGFSLDDFGLAIWGRFTDRLRSQLSYTPQYAALYQSFFIIADERQKIKSFFEFFCLEIFRRKSYTNRVFSAILILVESASAAKGGAGQVSLDYTAPGGSERLRSHMAGSSAVIFLPDDSAKNGGARPLMLSRIMGSPLLSWLVSSLAARGAGRFFLACSERWAGEAKACFPSGVELTAASDEEAPDLLHVFLSTADERDAETVIVTGAAVLVSPRLASQADVIPAPSCVYHVGRQALMDALDEKSVSFLDFLRQRGKPFTDREGVYSVHAAEELAAWQPILNLQHLHDLVRGGVEIWDYQNCYVDPTVRVGKGSVLMPGVILRGNTVIGQNCTVGPNSLLEDTVAGDGCTINASQLYGARLGNNDTVGPFCYVRPGTVAGDNVKLGDFVEIKNSTIGDGTKVPHLSYVGDSDVGEKVNFGCGTVTCNYDGKIKTRCTVGDGAFLGCNTNLVAPVTVGERAYTAAGSTITDNVPQQALGIARARQTNKRDWVKKRDKR